MRSPARSVRARTGGDPAGRGGGRSCGLADAKQALGALLLEVQGAGRRRLDPADAPAELGDIGPDPGIG
jgi:hypothetical protein